MPSMIDLQVLPENLTPAALAGPEFSASDLMDYVDAIKAKQTEVMDLLNAQVGIVNEAIEDRFGAKLAKLRKTKPDGKVSLTESGIVVARNAAKKVEWDGPKVHAVLQKNPEDVAALEPKVSVSIPEKNFKSCRDDLKEQLAACRSVKITEGKITIERKEA